MLENKDRVLYLGKIENAPEQAEIIALDAPFDGAVELLVQKTEQGVTLLFNDELPKNDCSTIDVSDEYFQAWLASYC